MKLIEPGSTKRFLAACAKEPSTKITISDRYRALIEHFSKQVAESLSRLSNGEIEVRGVVSRSSEASGVRIIFRILGEIISIDLPIEFAEEIVGRFLREESKFILAQLGERETVTISYLAGLILNDKAIFPSQRAYLQSVELIEDSLDKEKKQHCISLGVAIEGSESYISVSFSESLHLRFLDAAERTTPLASRKRWFAPVTAQGSIVANALVRDLQALLNLRVGAKIPVQIKETKLEVVFDQHSAFIEGRCVLPLEIDLRNTMESINVTLRR